MEILSIVMGIIKSLKFIKVEAGTFGVDAHGVFIITED